eukprot:11069933-Alexandrium_andersonii.AAC.1
MERLDLLPLPSARCCCGCPTGNEAAASAAEAPPVGAPPTPAMPSAESTEEVIDWDISFMRMSSCSFCWRS